jgi:hypothetical protein
MTATFFGKPPTAGSLVFVTNAQNDNEYARLDTLPNGFGDAEFTLELRVRGDNTIGFGDTSVQDSTNQRTLWSSNNNAIYGTSEWWFEGNFLLDCHNNTSFFAGTCSLQLANSGRVQWTFGDGAAADARLGDLHGLRGTTNILDGNSHTISCVRRWDGGSGAIFDLYVDGVLEDTETSTARTDMAATYWDGGFPGFRVNERFMCFGAEKQAAIGLLAQYEDWKGRIGEVRFWNVARSSAEILATYNSPIALNATGLVGVYRMLEGAGTTAADAKGSGGSITLTNGAGGQPVTWHKGATF